MNTLKSNKVWTIIIIFLQFNEKAENYFKNLQF